MTLTLQNVDVRIEDSPILRDVSVEVATGESLAVLGPSGSGKSTLLRAVAGLEPPTRGMVSIDGIDISDVPAHRRGIGLVFQDGALFPHRDVGRNVGYGLEVSGQGRREIDARVAEVLDLVGLPGFAGRSVATLSGGEAQRVGLARALAPAPRILLLDEPLGALDGPLRERLKEELRELFLRLGLTVLHVTHDITEAFAIGTRVAILREGTFAQVDTPQGLWARPADDWVATFLGMRNVYRDGGTATVIRPEAVRITAGTGACVLRVEPHGAMATVRVQRDDGSEIEALAGGLDSPLQGTVVAVSIDAAGVLKVPVWNGGGTGRAESSAAGVASFTSS